MPVSYSSCHCGNLRAELETRLRAEELTLRSCAAAPGGQHSSWGSRGRHPRT